MRWWSAWLMVVPIGCNWAFELQTTSLNESSSRRPDADPRSDIDRDGIKDIEDSCIAPMTDLLIDSDDDGVPNGGDLCPFDANAENDDDGDGVGDACDPFPALTGDRLRCLMAFSDPDMNVAMWRERDPVAMGWITYQPQILTGYNGAIIADWPLEGAVTTSYDLRASLRGLTNRPEGTVALLARAEPDDPATDSGCAIDVTSSSWRMRALPAGQQLGYFPAGSLEGFSLRLRVTVAATAPGPNLRCGFSSADPNLVIAFDLPADRVELGAGYTGLSTVTTGFDIRGLAVYERDDVPAL